jgi:hypothetical protein
MARVLTLLAILASFASAAAAADAPAVTLYGGKMTGINVDTTFGKSKVTLDLTVGDAELHVSSKDAAFGVTLARDYQKRNKDYQKLARDLKKRFDEAVKKGDEKKAQEIADQLTKEGEEVLSVPAVSAGTLTYKDKQWQLVGSIRALDPEKVDKGVERGSCAVQGEVVKGEFTVGDVISSLAIRAGSVTVVLTGDAVKDTLKGQVRAVGTLTLTEAGGAVLEAKSVEAVKK